MPDWLLPALMGPGGALVLALVFGKMGFRFLTELIDKQDVRFENLGKEFKSLSTQTLQHMAAQTTVTTLQTEALRALTEQRRRTDTEL